MRVQNDTFSIEQSPFSHQNDIRSFAFHVRNMRKYIDFYRQYYVILDIFLTTLNTLPEGILSTPIIDPVTLQRCITTIQDELIKNTNYKPVFQDIYEFYAH